MSTPRTRPRAVAYVLATAVVLSAVAAFSASHVAVARPVVVATGSNIADSAIENFQFTTPEFANVPTNTTVNVTFSNDDSTGNDHTFTILDREGWVVPASADIPTLLTSYGYLVSVNVSHGQTKTLNFSSPGPGWYEFFCSIAGHFQEGMYGFIAFGEALPPNLTLGASNLGPGTAVFVIVGTIVALTVITIVLGFVVGRRHGAVHEMPPERLGYPEPPAAAPPPGPGRG